MAENLRVKIVCFKGRVMNVRFRSFKKEEAMMINQFLSAR